MHPTGSPRGPPPPHSGPLSGWSGGSWNEEGGRALPFHERRPLCVQPEVRRAPRDFRVYLEQTGERAPVTVHETADDLLRSCDLVVFATVAGKPHVTDPGLFAHRPLVLHVSLRDLAPEIILASANIVDDVEHCLKADTSVHLAEQRTGNREFLTGTLYDVITGAVRPDPAQPLVFSPFGLGVLDLAVGKYVHDLVRDAGELHVVDDFFHELDRYGQRRTTTG